MFNNDNILFSERKILQKGNVLSEGQNGQITKKNVFTKQDEGHTNRNSKNDESQSSKISKNKKFFEKIVKQRDSIGAYIKNHAEKVQMK